MRKLKSLILIATAALSIGTASPAVVHADAAADATNLVNALQWAGLFSSVGNSLSNGGLSAAAGSTGSATGIAGLLGKDLGKCPTLPTGYQVRPGVVRYNPVRGDSALDTSVCLLTSEQRRQALFDAVNELRAEKNITPLIRTEEADLKSQAWSEQIAKEGRCYHAPFDGIHNAKVGGENALFCAQVSTPRDCANQWKNSPGHYTNLMNPDWDRAGIGMAATPDGMQFSAVQQFRPKGWKESDG
ncbi:MAG: CAP domain-containing protein [Corynebacterium sp.]|nr:CAP domain-containing protein [Corynebacterium sp.]